KHHLWRESSHIVFMGYQAEGTIGRKIIDGAKTIRLFGEEIAVKAHIHTLGGFSAHADQKGLLDWLSHFKTPQLEVFLNHGEEKISRELAERIHERFPFKTTLPRWREKRFLFGYGREEMEERLQEEEREEPASPWKTFLLLSHQLDRNYKRLRRKLRHLKSKGREVHDLRSLRKLEEINQRIEDLNSEIEMEEK
ncbi:MAG: MBL fold metallo-hydrolase RNA specificity domain-containing protein, partial [Thermodesulfobacteriota bacterium]